jgi:hypothetical protein
MALYVVLHHRLNPHPKWMENKWQDDDCIERITTDPVTADLCRRKEIVYIHRCGWKRIPPITSCSVRVAAIDGPPERPTVHFSGAVVVRKPVGKRLYGIEKPHYEAPAPR